MIKQWHCEHHVFGSSAVLRKSEDNEWAVWVKGTRSEVRTEQYRGR